MKQYRLTLLLTILMSMVGVKVSAANEVQVTFSGRYDFKVNGIYYRKHDNSGTYNWSSGYNSYSGDIVIPKAVTYGGTTYSVKGIGSEAFKNCVNLTSVSIPESVNSIYSNPFEGCTNLQSIVVNSGNTTYDSRDNCNAIINKSTKTLVIGCKNTVIPSSVTEINYNAFRGCSGLTSVTIPSGITSIGSDAFADCNNLTSVIINDLASWCSINFSNSGANPLTYAHHLFLNDTEITGLIIPDGVTSISDYAFYGCSNLSSVSFSSSLTNIGHNAFEGTAWYNNQPDGMLYVGKLAWKYKGTMPEGTALSIKNGTMVICESALSGYPALASVTIPNTVATIGLNAFKGCSNLTTLTIGNNVTTIGNAAFSGCRGLTSVVIPNSVTNIGRYAFSGCSGITSLTIGDGLTEIDSYVFENCSAMNRVVIGKGLTSINQSAFAGVGSITSLEFHNELAYGSWFNSKESLKNVIIGDEVKVIGSFSGCTKITSFIIGNGVERIGEQAFWDCSGLTSISIGNSVEEIGSYAFCGCSSLESIHIGRGVKKMYPGMFQRCYELASITVDNENMKYDSRDNCNAIIDKETNTLIMGCKNSTIPNGVACIGDDAFRTVKGLTSLTIPYGIKTIENGAFAYCSDLANITIPNSVTIIGSDAFLGTPWYDNQPDSLVYAGSVAYKYKGTMPEGTIIEIKNGTLGISPKTFDSCSGLSAISIPSSVTNIGDYAFQGCGGLSAISIPSSVTNIGDYAFQGCGGLSELTLPAPCVLGKGAFKNCSSIPSVVIPEGVTEINQEVFSGCSQLAEVSFPKSLLTIGIRAFENCTSLMHVDLPKRLKEIEQEAFNWCGNKGIKVVKIPSSVERIAYLAFGGWKTNGIHPGICGLDTIYFKSRNSKGLTSFTNSNSNYPLQPSENPIVMYQGRGDGNIQYYKYSNWYYCNYTDSTNYLKPADLVLCGQGQGYLSIELKNVEKIVGFQFNLQLPAGLTVATAEENYIASLSGRKADHSLSVEKKDDNLYHFTSVSMNNQPFSGNDGEILRLKVLVDANTNLGEYNIAVTETELTSYDEDYDLVEQIISKDDNGKLTIQESIFGDISGDGVIDVSDYIGVANYILGEQQEVIIPAAADVNNDQVVDVSDYIGVANLILYNSIYGQTQAASRGKMYRSIANTDISDIDNVLYIEPIETTSNAELQLSLKMKNTAQIRGFQVDVYLPEGVTAVKNNNGRIVAGLNAARLPDGSAHTLTVSERPDGAIRLLCGSQYDETFTGNDGEIATLTINVGENVEAGVYPLRLGYVKLTETNISNYYLTDEVVTTMTVTENNTPPTIDVTDITQLDNAIYIEPFEGRVSNDVNIEVRLKNVEEATSYGFELVLPEGMSIATEADGSFDEQVTLSARHKGHSAVTNKLSATTYKVAVASMNSKLLTGNDGVVVTIKAHVADNMAVGQYPVVIQNPLLVNGDATKPDMQETTTAVTIDDYVKGDVDGDTEVDLADAVIVINHYVGKPVNKFNEKAADVDGDGIVDLADAVKIINYYVGKIPSLSRKYIADELDPQ